MHQTIISSLMSAHSHSVSVILLWAINKPAFTKIKARHQTMAEAYLSERYNYARVFVSKDNTHKQKTHFWYCAFPFYSHEIHKTVVVSELHNLSSIDIYSWHIQSLLSVVGAFRPGRGIIFSPDWFLHQTSLPIIKRLQYISDYQVWQRESNFVNVRRREWLVSKRETILRWQPTERCRLCFDSLWWWQIDS